MKRRIIISVTVDWEDYDDVSDELILDDVFESLVLKDGVKIEQLKIIKETKHWVKIEKL
jgi:hypothetical protein